MTLPPDGPWIDPRIPAPVVPDPPTEPAPAKEPRNGLVLALAIACAVLLLTTIGFGGAAAWLWFDRSATAAPEPTATPTGTAEASDEPQIVQGIEVSTASDLEFGSFALSEISPDDYVSLYATVTNKDSDQAAEMYFDVTAYAEDGRILDRGAASVYILPGQVSMFDGVFSSDITEATSIKVEQTMGELVDPIMTGEVTTDSLRGGDGFVEATLTSTLSQVPEYPELFIAGFVDGKLIGVCYDMPDIPANAGFTAGCYLEPASADSPQEYTDFPKDAKFEAYLALDIPW